MSCGLGDLIPYFECQYPQVIADNAVAVNSSGASSGMGDYVDPFSFPIPQYLAPGNSRGLADYIDPFAFPIPQYLTPGNDRGLGCACGGACCGGMGSLFDGTGFLGSGLFTSADPSTWGAGEFGALAIGTLLLYTLVKGVNKVERGYRGTTRAVAKKVSKVKSGVKKRGRAAKTLVTGRS